MSDRTLSRDWKRDREEIRQNVERGKAEVGEGTGAEVRECGRSRWRHGGQ